MKIVRAHAEISAVIIIYGKYKESSHVDGSDEFNSDNRRHRNLFSKLIETAEVFIDAISYCPGNKTSSTSVGTV